MGRAWADLAASTAGGRREAARMAAEGRGPLVDLIAEANDWPRHTGVDVGRSIAIAARRLARAGRPDVAAALAEMWADLREASPDMRLLADQVASGIFAGDDFAAWTARRHVLEGRLTEAAALLEGAVAADRCEVARERAAVARALGDWHGAAAILELAAVDAPEDVSMSLLRAAIRDRCASGAGAAIVTSRFTLRPVSDSRTSEATLSQLLSACGVTPSVEGPGPATLAHLRRAIEDRHVATARPSCDPAVIEAALQADTLIVVPSGSLSSPGFFTVVGIERATGQVLVQDPADAGPRWMPVRDAACAAPYGSAGILVVGGSGPEGRRRLSGFDDDRTAIAIDRLLTDADTLRSDLVADKCRAFLDADDGAEAVWHLLATVSPRYDRRRILLAAARRFPQAAWPLYLAGKAGDGSLLTAAWARRPGDASLHTACALEAERTGKAEAAVRHARAALLVDPLQVDACLVLVRAERHRDPVLARAGAHLARLLAPADPAVELAAAATDVAAGDPVTAYRNLSDAVAVLDDTDTRLVDAAVRAGYRCGHLGKLRRHVAALGGRDPRHWLTRLDVETAWGEGHAACADAAEALQGCGAEPALVRTAAWTAVVFAASRDRTGRTDALAAALGSDAAGLRALARAYASLRDIEQALRALDWAVLAAPGDAANERLYARIALGATGGLAHVEHVRVLAAIGSEPDPTIAALLRALLEIGHDAHAVEAQLAEVVGGGWPAAVALAVREPGSVLDDVPDGAAADAAAWLRSFGRSDLALPLLYGRPRAAASYAEVLADTGDAASALQVLSRLEDLCAVDERALLGAALRAGDWTTSRRVSERLLMRNGTLGATGHSLWWVRAAWAGALHVAGSPEPARAILQVAPYHPVVLAVLARAEASGGAGLWASPCYAQLAALAPGLAESLEGEVTGSARDEAAA